MLNKYAPKRSSKRIMIRLSIEWFIIQMRKFTREIDEYGSQYFITPTPPEECQRFKWGISPTLLVPPQFLTSY
jgi:hypothetical protein